MNEVDEAIAMLTALKDKVLMGDIQITDVDIINTLIKIEENRKERKINPEPISAEGILNGKIRWTFCNNEFNSKYLYV